MSIESLRRDEFDTAILTLHCERPGLTGAELLAAIVNEANDAMARLKERGSLIGADDEEDGPVLGKCEHGVDLDRDFCPKGCRV